MDSCRISDEGLRMLAQGLARNARHSVTALSLEENQIHCRGASHLAKLLEQRGSRWASSRRFGGYCTPASGQGMGLRYLSLKGNSIAAVGAKALAEPLIQNDNSLETLNLEGNKICDWSAGWFAMVLRNHAVLRCLNLRHNPISQDGLEELRSACKNVQASLVVVAPGSDDVPGEEASKAVVYITEAQKPAPAPGHGAGAFRRPTSASRRQALGSLARHSRPASAGERTSEAGRSPRSSSARPPRSRPSSRRDCGGRPPRARRAPVPAPTTYAVGHVPCTGPSATAPLSLRERPGERVMCADEKEAATVIVSPTRWLRKPRGALETHPWERRRPASSCSGCPTALQPQGGGAAAARSLKRSSSAPGSTILEERPDCTAMSDGSATQLAGAQEES